MEKKLLITNECQRCGDIYYYTNTAYHSQGKMHKRNEEV